MQASQLPEWQLCCRKNTMIMTLINTNSTSGSSFYRSPSSPAFPSLPPVKCTKPTRQSQNCTVPFSLCRHTKDIISSLPSFLMFFYSHFLWSDVKKGTLMGTCSTSRPFSVMWCNLPRNFTFFSTNAAGISKALVNLVVY